MFPGKDGEGFSSVFKTERIANVYFIYLLAEF